MLADTRTCTLQAYWLSAFPVRYGLHIPPAWAGLLSLAPGITNPRRGGRFTYQEPRPHPTELVALPPEIPKMPPLTSPVGHASLFKICAFCDSSILRSNQTWGEHQASISKLKEAASEGCIFCAQLWEDLKTLHSRPTNLVLPVHRWSLRRSARISESLCSLVITFRSFGEDIVTPTRTFYAFNNKG